MEELKGKKVLIVDDSGYMRKVIRRHLEPQGLEIVGEAKDGIEAVQLYKELKPDVVTMDISMKEMNGIEATKRIKQIDPNAKVIVISALGDARFIKEAIKAGARDYIIKPFQEERLLSSIKNALIGG